MATKLTWLIKYDTTAPSGRELYHLQFSLQAASPETFGYSLMFWAIASSKTLFWNSTTQNNLLSSVMQNSSVSVLIWIAYFSVWLLWDHNHIVYLFILFYFIFAPLLQNVVDVNLRFVALRLSFHISWSTWLRETNSVALHSWIYLENDVRKYFPSGLCSSPDNSKNINAICSLHSPIPTSSICYEFSFRNR
jgi:hypothetical protein